MVCEFEDSADAKIAVYIQFSHKFSNRQTAAQCSMGDPLISVRAIWDWFLYCREVSILSAEEKYANRWKIGGPKHVVDECKFGGRKYYRGIVVEGNWILGVIDINTKQVRMAICP